jgi:hypothetical protein
MTTPTTSSRRMCLIRLDLTDLTAQEYALRRFRLCSIITIWTASLLDFGYSQRTT